VVDPSIRFRESKSRAVAVSTQRRLSYVWRFILAGLLLGCHRMAPAPSSAEAILAAAGATERSGDSLNSDNCHLFPKTLDRFDGHGASLSVNFGPSSNSVSTTSLRPNNEIPISPRTKRTVPATMSQCGYARNKAKAFVIFASFCTSGGGRDVAPRLARHDNPLHVLTFQGSVPSPRDRLCLLQCR
jgi:hypothetical protein